MGPRVAFFWHTVQISDRGSVANKRYCIAICDALFNALRCKINFVSQQKIKSATQSSAFMFTNNANKYLILSFNRRMTVD